MKVIKLMMQIPKNKLIVSKKIKKARIRMYLIDFLKNQVIKSKRLIFQTQYSKIRQMKMPHQLQMKIQIAKRF